MSQKKVRAGFIGAGAFISSRHLPTAGSTDFIEIRAISDLNEELLAKHTETYHPGYTTTDYKKLLADPEIDLIVIGTRQDTHAKLIVESLDAGKWVWCEKPMCDVPTEEKAVLEAEKRAKGRLAIGFNRRFAPSIQKIKEILEKMPKPWIITYRLQSNGGYKTRRNDLFYYDRPHIVYEGCHILDLAHYIMQMDPSRVFMSGTKDENDIVTLEYEDGSRFVLIITSHAGGYGLEKEAMEVFTPGGAMSMRDFIELRVRGIPGEHDYMFPSYNSPFNEEIMRYGFDFWQRLSDRVVWQDKPLAPSIVPIVRAPSLEPPYEDEIEKLAAPLEGTPWQTRCYVGDKGWRDAFQHFAKACLEHTEPHTANGTDGKFASDLGFTLIESKKTGNPIPWK